MEGIDEGEETLQMQADSPGVSKQDGTLLGGNRESIQDSGEGTVMLQRTEPLDNQSVTSDGALHDHIVEDLNRSRMGDMEAYGQHQPTGNLAMNLSGVSDGESGGDAPLEVLAVSASACPDHDGALVNRDAGNQQMGASELVDTERKNCSSVLRKESDSGSDRKPSDNLKDISSSEMDLMPHADSRGVFNDANLAQLQAQILVMGILRKGNSPSNDQLESACPQRYEGVGDPPPSKKRKPSGKEALPREAGKEPSGHAGVVTHLMTSLKEDLSLPEDAVLVNEDDGYRQLRLAQRSAHDAMLTAASALAQSHMAWSQIRRREHSDVEISREAQIASVAAAVAAATSVAKAAVEAAKAIANVSMKDSWRGGDQDVKSSFPSRKKNKKSNSDRSLKSQILASEAPGMTSEDAMQTGTVLPLASGKASGGSKVKRKVLPKTKNTKKSRAGDRGLRRVTLIDSSQPEVSVKQNVPHEDLVDTGVAVDIDGTRKSIAVGSAVEVMTDEEGLRGGWFSGKVLKINKARAYVAYDEILDDDGSGKVKEWFPLKASGSSSGPRSQVRPLHPYSSVEEARSKKRQRVASGARTWAVGDCVDAFIQDGWWEGDIIELKDFDEAEATVYFPGENDTQIVKTRNLRPSFQWKDGVWMPFAGSTINQGKTGCSSNKSKRKTSFKDDARQLTAELITKGEDLDNEVATLSSTRKRRAQEASTKASNGKKSSWNVEDSSDEVGASTPSEFTWRSPDSKEQARVGATMASSQMKARNNAFGSRIASGKNKKAHIKTEEKDASTVAPPKKLGFNVDQGLSKAVSRKETPKVSMTRGGGKLKDKKQQKRRPRRR